MTSTAYRRVVLTVAMAGLIALSATGVSHAVPMPLDTGLVVWLKADAAPGIANGQTFGGTSPTTIWPDVTTGAVGDGIGQDAEVSNGGPTYRTGQINGLPAVDFGGGGAFAYAGPIGIAGPQAPFTAIVVGSTRKTGEQRPLQIGAGPGGTGVSMDVGTAGFRYNNGYNAFTDATEKFPSDGSFHIGVWTMNDTSTYGTSSYYRDGVAGTSNGSSSGGSTTNINDTGYVVGRGIHPSSGNPHMYLTGMIAEILVYDRELSATELDKVGSYLAGKYGIAASFAGAEIYWDNGSLDITSPVSPPYPGDNLWMTPSNWRANNSDPMDQFPNDTLPGPTDRVNISLHDVPADPPAPCNVEAGDDLLVNSVRVGGNFGLGVGGHGVLNINGGTLTVADNGGVGVGGRLEIGGTGNRNGVVNVNGGTLNVGRDIITGASIGSGTSTLNYTGGTLSVATGDIDVDTFHIEGVTYTHSTGTLDLGTLDLGGAADGTLTQTGGTVLIANGLAFGNAASVLGVTSGSLTLTGNITGALGTVKVAGASSTMTMVENGVAGNGGTIRLSGGATLALDSNVDVDWGQNVEVLNASGGAYLQVDNAGTGSGQDHTLGTLTFNGSRTITIDSANGNTVTFASVTVDGDDTRAGNADVTIAGDINGAGKRILFEGGTTTIHGDTSILSFRVGYNAGADATVVYDAPGKTLNNTGTFFVGNDGTGALTVVGGTSVVIANGLRIGYNATGVGTLTIGDATTSGDFTANAGNTGQTYVGYNGDGTLHLINGSLTAKKGFYVAYGAGSSGVVVMGDGTTNPDLTTSGANFEVGRGDVGIFTQYSGAVTVQGNEAIIGHLAGSDGTLNLIGGSFTASKGFYVAYDAGSTGAVVMGDGLTAPTLTVSGGNLEVGRDGLGSFTQNSGAVVVQADNFVVGQNPAGHGTYTLNDGTLTTLDTSGDHGHVRVGNTAKGVFIQNGGLVDVATDLELGNNDDPAADGTYTLNGGTLDISRDLIIGRRRAGTFNYIDGTLLIGNATYIGGNEETSQTANPNSDGVLNLGSATTAPTLNTQQIEVGRHGTGEINHFSGDLVVHDANLVISQYVNSTGTYNLYDGTIGFAGTTGERSINFNRGRGVFNQFGGVVNADYGIKMAQNANEGDHEWNLHDGVVNVSGVNFELGRDAKAVFTQFDGEVNIALSGPAVNLVLGQNATGDGAYILHDGSLRLGNQLNIANRGKGTLTQEGGLVDVAKELQIGNTENEANTDGLYEMKGGSLTTGDQLIVGRRNQGVFHQTGGTVTVGTGLVIGDGNYGTTDGTYILDGGILNITNNLAIGHHGTGTFDFIASDVPLTMNATRWIYVGGEGSTNANAAPNANGTFNIGDGVSSPVLNARQFEVGRHGVGVVNQKSGTVTVHGDDNLVISQYANSEGTYHMMGGGLELGSGARGNINFNYGTGLFVQSGGRVELNGGDVNIARYNVSNSTYRLEGGTLDMGGGDIVFGLDEPNGNGTFTFTGGRLENMGAFRGPTPTLPDASGNGNGGAIAMLAPRIFGGALEFGAGNDHVDFGDIAAMSSQDAFTVSMWFQRDVDRNDATNHGIDNILIAKSSNSTNDNFELGTDGGQAEVYLDSTTGADATARYGVGVQNDQWHHIVLTYDPARDPADEMVLYLDGSPAASDGRWSGNLDQSNGSHLTLGMARPDPSGGSRMWGDFDGLMDDVAIWSRAIAPAEIAALYNGGAGAPASSLAGFSDSIVLYTPMDSLDYTVTLHQQGGVLAPGASAGITSILGDYIMGEAGTYEVELGDTYIFDPANLPSLTDFIYVGGDATLDGLLDILNLGGFDPKYGDAFDIMYAAGTIDAAGLEVGSEFEHFFHISVYDYELGGQVLRLTHVPEPTTLTLLALGGLGLVARRRRRQAGTCGAQRVDRTQ